MIQLFFDVEHQRIRRTDTYKPVAKSVNYLYAHFDFLTSEWNNLIKTAIFRTETTPYEVVLDENNECLVPSSAIENEGDIYVSIYAGELITTNKSRIHIYETGYGSDLLSLQSEVPISESTEQPEQNEGGVVESGNSES